MKHLFKVSTFALLLCGAMVSCQEDERVSVETGGNEQGFIKPLKVDVAQKEFAKILSEAVYNNIEARAFLKEEALKQFDRDYDVFYPVVKNKKMENGQTFRELLLSYTDTERLKQIEKTLPLLTMYVPDLSLFVDITPKNWDITDEEVPVAFSNEKEGSILFLNGDSVMTLKRNEIPGYHLLLVKNNERVRVLPHSRAAVGDAEQVDYEFIDEVFDGSLPLQTPIQTRVDNLPDDNNSYVDKDKVNSLIVQAWETMKETPTLQRDYIYYGLTPTHQEGSLNMSVDEYLYRFQIDPNAYFRIADQNEDPRIKNESTSNKKAELTREEIIRRLWTDGRFEIRFRFFTGEKNSTALNPSDLTFNPSPNDLFNINIKTDYRHSTMFRHSKYTYTIDPNQLGRKWYYPWRDGKDARLPKWDISRQSLERYVLVYEVDESETYKETRTYSTTYNTGFKSSAEGTFSGVKVGLGVDATKVQTNTSSVEVTTNKGDDYLGSLNLYFYDSIIINEREASFKPFRKHKAGYKLKDISNGTVTVTMMPIVDSDTRALM